MYGYYFSAHSSLGTCSTTLSNVELKSKLLAIPDGTEIHYIPSYAIRYPHTLALGPMDRGWDIPQSGSGAGSIDQESSFYQDSDGFQNWNPYDPSNAWDNSNEHETFWGAPNHNINQDDEVFGTLDNQHSEAQTYDQAR